MELVIRIALMFFFIQFLVVVTMMSVALLRARPEAPVCATSLNSGGLKRSAAHALHLPSLGLSSIARRMRSMRERIHD